MDALRKLDQIAYIRFASVYRAFTDIESLKEAVVALEEGRIASFDERNLQLPFPGDSNDGEPRPRLLQDVESRHFASVSGKAGSR